MPAVTVHKPKSFSELVTIVEDFQDAREASWYRGLSKTSHTLKPTLFRHGKKTDATAIDLMERELAATFRKRSPPFVSQALSNEWERMFFMQHYGIPTRLLDWSESPFVALYFAICDVERSATGKPKNDAAVWMLDPIAWNRSALSDISFKEGILDTDQQQVKSYSPGTELSDRKVLPVMIYGTHNSPRIVAQRGTFALFGKGTDPMEKVFASGDFLDGVLHQIVIEKDVVDKISVSLFRKGISDSTIYPDLFGLSMELKRAYGF